MHDRVTICGGVLGGHPRLVADEILALSVANCRSTWRWRDDSSASQAFMKRLDGKNPRRAIGKVLTPLWFICNVCHSLELACFLWTGRRRTGGVYCY